MNGNNALLLIPAYLIPAYLIPSMWEALAHRMLLHATLEERARWRRWRCLGQLFRLAYFYHYRIHHHRTFRQNLAKQFASSEEKAHLDAALKGEIALRLHDNRYGTTIVSPWESITYVAVPLSLNTLLFGYLEPLMLPAAVFLSFVPYVLTKYVHPMLHMTSEEIVNSSAKPLRLFAKTRLFRFIQAYHYQHHRHENRNFNLMPGADWVIRWVLKVMKTCTRKTTGSLNQP